MAGRARQSSFAFCLCVPAEKCNKIVISVRNPENPACKLFVSDSRKRSTLDVMLHFGGCAYAVPGHPESARPLLDFALFDERACFNCSPNPTHESDGFHRSEQ